jgi:hypothetical protein
MAISYAKLLGAFVRWLLKGCKTSLRKEINGEYEATWGSSYNLENYIIGIASVFVMLFIVYLFI